MELVNLDSTALRSIDSTATRQNMQKNIRTYGSRVRTGCLTCRRRRVKCDEAKPHCKRCTVSNRPCEGYATQSKAPSNLRMVIYTPSGLTFSTTEAERHSLDFFLAQSKDCFPSDFSEAVLQAARTDQVFAYATVALGAAQRLYEYECDRDTDGRLGNLAMQQYGKALHLLQSSIKTRSIETFLMCAVLFTSFESLRGFRKSAAIHIRSGLNLLRQSPPARWSRVSHMTMTYIFTRLENQLVELLGVSLRETLGNGQPASLGAMGTESPSRNLHYSLDSLLNRIFYYQLTLALISEGQLDPVEDSLSHQRACLVLEQLHLSFSSSMPHHSLEWINQNPLEPDSLIFQIWNLSARMCIAVCLGDGAEETWDTFVDEFDTIVSLSEMYLERTSSPSRTRTFGFTIGVIPPLFVTATRCRKPRIRRRAIQLLGDYKRREGMWDSTHAAHAARQVMEMEEKTMDVPSEGGRVRAVVVVLDDEDRVALEFEQ
ncbi:hypothetical protein BJX99DRAFT_18538 [Aspergillus californicus]